MSLTIYFLRHGETDSSKSDGFCGELNPDLTPSGKEMAEAFAKVYKSIAWKAIFVSPMKRTIATAKPLCETIGMAMQIRDGLKEMNFGEWEGKSKEEVKQEYLEDYFNWMTEPAWNAPTRGETATEVASRASLVLAEIQQNYSSGNVLVVAHKSTIRIVLSSLLGMDIGRYRDRIDMPVASISIVKLDLHGPLLQVLCDRYHLPEHLRNLPGT
ncbi:MAG: histidine phosphatase family protein [Prochloraceae cyanobacterium]